MASSDIGRYLICANVNIYPMSVMGITIYSPLHMTSDTVCSMFNKIDSMCVLFRILNINFHLCSVVMYVNVYSMFIVYNVIICTFKWTIMCRIRTLKLLKLV